MDAHPEIMSDPKQVANVNAVHHALVEQGYEPVFRSILQGWIRLWPTLISKKKCVSITGWKNFLSEPVPSKVRFIQRSHNVHRAA
jgi:hypothetical protein